jgi:hypothetical protein
VVDQSAVDGWNLVGEFDFAAGGMQSIRVDDNTGEPNATETMIVFDALRLTPIAGPTDGDGEPGDAGGCATGHTSNTALLVVFGLGFALRVGFVRRRRRPARS